jgi:hypothetical protein
METIIVKKARKNIELPKRYVGKDLKINIVVANELETRKSEIIEMSKDADYLKEINEINDDFKNVDSEGI